MNTLFLLPALGAEIEKEAMEATYLFKVFEIYYLEIALLEIM